MNWKGQALPIFAGGLPSKSQVGEDDAKKWQHLPQPASEKVVAMSPYAQIVRGSYRTPTFLIHGTLDDLIPWQESQRVHYALADVGVRTGLAIVRDRQHLFDLHRDGADGAGWQAVRAGYEFLFDVISR
jgi:acetyl esterase/lipase